MEVALKLSNILRPPQSRVEFVVLSEKWKGTAGCSKVEAKCKC